MKNKVNSAIKRLEARLAEQRKLVGNLYTFEMAQIEAQLEILKKLKGADDDN